MKAKLVVFLCLMVITAEARLPKLIPYRKGNLWGYCDSSKKIIIQPQWKTVGFYSGPTAKVSNGRQWGLIDTTGKPLTEINYEWISDETANGTRVATRSSIGKVGAINSRGEIVVPFDYEWLLISGNYLQGMKKDKTGFFNSEGKMVVPFIYDGRGDPAESLNIPGRFAVSKASGYGVVDTTGNTIIPFKYDWISGLCGYIHAWSRNDKATLLFDANGTRVNATDTCEPAVEPRLYKPFRDVFRPGNPYTWLDTNGHRATPLYFLTTSNFSNGMADFQDFDSLYGFVNEQFEVIFPSTFFFVNSFDEQGLARVWVRDPNCRTCAPLDGYVSKYGTKYWED